MAVNLFSYVNLWLQMIRRELVMNILCFKKVFFALFCGVMLALPVQSQAALETPKTLKGATVVSAEKAQSMMKKGVLIVDARVAHEYVEERIKGAKSIPYKEKSAKVVGFDASVDRFDLSKLPANKNTPVIFYCNAGKCWKSYKACTAAIKVGYRKVHWLRGGIPEWKAKGLPTE